MKTFNAKQILSTILVRGLLSESDLENPEISKMVLNEVQYDAKNGVEFNAGINANSEPSEKNDYVSYVNNCTMMAIKLFPEIYREDFVNARDVFTMRTMVL